MTTYHNFTEADVMSAGNALHKGHNNGRRGALLSHVYVRDYGAVTAYGVASGAATSILNTCATTNMPNASTKTYSADTDGTAPLDAATRIATDTIVFGPDGPLKVWVFDTERNILCTPGNAAAADTVITVTGYDVYKNKIVEAITIASSGDAAVAGKKAFKYVRSFTIYSAGNTQTNDTLSIAGGLAIGLPYYVDKKGRVQIFADGVLIPTTSPVTVGVTTTPSATTGDVRGTWTATNANGTIQYVAWISVKDHGTNTGLFGAAQYGG